MQTFLPKPYQKDPVTLRIDVDKLARMDALCAARGLNRSEFINRCIDFALEHMPAEPQQDSETK